MQDRDASASSSGLEPRGRATRAGLLLGYLVVSLFLVVACVAIWVHHTRAEAVEGHRELASISQLVTNEVADWLAERREDASYFSDPIIAGPLSEVAEVASGHADETTLERLSASLERLRVRHGATALFFVDAHGAVRLSFPRQGAEASGATLALAASAVSSGQVAVSKLGSHGEASGHTIELAGPVVAPGGEAEGGPPPVVGAIVVRYDTGKVLGPVLATWSTHSMSGRVLLAWKEADGWAWLDGRTGKVATTSSSGGGEEVAYLARDLEEPVATVWHEGAGAREQVGLWQEVPDTPWRVVVEMSAREAEAGGGSATFYLSLALALSLAMGGAMALQLWATR